MTSNDALDTLRHIKLGVKEVFYYDYDGQALPLRPISSYELDDCFYKALEYATPKVADLVIKLKLKLFKGTDQVDFSNEDYVSLQKHYNSISYWIVYHSMKDFQDEDFTKPIFKDNEILPKGIFLIRQMKYVHNMADIITNTSYKPKDVIKQVIRTDGGKEIAYLLIYFNVPLTTITDMTKLQRDFIIYSKGEIKKLTTDDVKTKQYEFSGEKTTIANIYRKVGIYVPEADKDG
jgi:hypothetical protein